MQHGLDQQAQQQQMQLQQQQQQMNNIETLLGRENPMAKLVMESERRSGGNDERSRDGWSQKRRGIERRRVLLMRTEKNASRPEKMYRVLVERTNSESATIAMSVTELDGVEAWPNSTQTTADEHWE